MKTLALTTMAILATGLLLAQPTPEWSSGISTNFSMYFYDNPKIKFDNAGDLVVVGNINNGSNEKDIVVIKYSPSGTIIWQQTFNSIHNKDDEVIDFTTDTQKNIILTGKSAVDSVNTNLITVKYNATGNFKWVTSFAGNTGRENIGNSIAVDQSGNSYITGSTSIDTLGHQKMLVTKIDSMGNTRWTYFYKTDTLAVYEGKKIKNFGNEIRILGTYVSLATYINKFIVLKLDTSGTVLFSNERLLNRPASCFYLDNAGNSYLGFGYLERFKIMKVDSSGTVAWYDSIPTNLPSSTTGDEVRAIITDSLQNVYITGRHYGEDYGGPTYTNADMLTAKYSASGHKLWSKRYEYLSSQSTGRTLYLHFT